MVARAAPHHWWFRQVERLLARYFAPHLPRPPVVLLDMGCGPGALSKPLGRLGEVVGLDIAQEALELAKGAGMARLVLADACELPFPDETFSGVVAITTLMGIRDWERAVAEAARVTAAGGVLFFLDPAFEVLRRSHDAAVGCVNRFRLSHYSRAFALSGLEVVVASYTNAVLFLPALVIALLERARVLRSRESDFDRGYPPRVMDWLGRIEAALVGRGVPFGLDVVACCRKPP